jgi:hypothetical protein
LTFRFLPADSSAQPIGLRKTQPRKDCESDAAPTTLLIVGERDETVLEWNRESFAELRCEKRLDERHGPHGRGERRLQHAIKLDKDIRGLALDDEDLTPLWDWIGGLK